MPTLHQYLGNPVLSRLGRLFFRIPVRRLPLRDPWLSAATGFWSSGSARRVWSSPARWSCGPRCADLRIAEVPTTLRPDGRSRAPHLRTWRDGWRHLRFLLAFSPRWLLYYPSMAFQFIGLAGVLWLALGPRKVGGVGFDIHSMLAFATMFVLGVQGLGLAVVARSYAAHLGLLAPSIRLDRILARFSLERGLVLGGLFLLIGAGCFVAALTSWGAVGFGALDTVRSMRLPIIGMVLTVTGFQLIIVSFTLSLTRIGED